MDALTSELIKALGSGAMSQIGKSVGADKKSTESALSAALPVLFSALANNASKPAGAKSLHDAITRDHDGSVLNNLDEYLAHPKIEDGKGILSHALGAKQPAVEKGLAAKTGLSGEQIGQILTIAAPIVMAALGSKQRKQNLDADGLASILGGELQQTRKSKDPDLLGVLNTVFDADQDGSAVDELMGLVGDMMKKK